MAEIDKLPDDEQEVVYRYMLAETQQEKDSLIEDFDQEKRLWILSAVCDYSLKIHNSSEAEGCDNEYCFKEEDGFEDDFLEP